MWGEIWLLHVFLVDYLRLRIAHVLESILEVLLRDICGSLELLVGKLRLPVKLEKHHCLVAAYQELIRLRGYIHWTKLNAAIIVEPCQVFVLMLVLIELFELYCDGLYLRRQGALNFSLIGPVAIGEDLGDKLDLLLVSNGARLSCIFELNHEVLR